VSPDARKEKLTTDFTDFHRFEERGYGRRWPILVRRKFWREVNVEALATEKKRHPEKADSVDPDPFPQICVDL
jgi:hypothetical protein